MTLPDTPYRPTPKRGLGDFVPGEMYKSELRGTRQKFGDCVEQLTGFENYRIVSVCYVAHRHKVTASAFPLKAGAVSLRGTLNRAPWVGSYTTDLSPATTVPLGRLSKLAPNGWSKFYGAARLVISNSNPIALPLHWHSSKAWKKLSKPSLGAKHHEQLQNDVSPNSAAQPARQSHLLFPVLAIGHALS